MRSVTLPVNTDLQHPHDPKQDKPSSPLRRSLSLPVIIEAKKQGKGAESGSHFNPWLSLDDGQERDGGDPKQDEVPESGSPSHPLPPLIESDDQEKSHLSLSDKGSSQIPKPQLLSTLQKAYPASPEIEHLEPQEQRFDDQFRDLILYRLKNYYKKQVEPESELYKFIDKSIISKETDIVPALVQAHNLVAQCNEEELRDTNIIKKTKEGGNQYTIPLTQTPSEEEQNITIIDKATGYLYMATFKQANGSYQMQCSYHPELQHYKSEEQLFTEMCALVQAEGHIVNVTINSKSIDVFGDTNLATLNQKLQPGPNLSPTGIDGRPIQGGTRVPAASASV